MRAILSALLKLSSLFADTYVIDSDRFIGPAKGFGSAGETVVRIGWFRAFLMQRMLYVLFLRIRGRRSLSFRLIIDYLLFIIGRWRNGVFEDYS